MKKRECSYNTKIIVLMIVIFIMTLGTYLVIYNINIKSFQADNVNNISFVGKRQKEIVTDWVEEIKYELKLYSQLDEFQGMDKVKISNMVSFIKSYKDVYSNIIVLDQSDKLVYGYIEDLHDFLNTSYMRDAKDGSMSISNTINTNGSFYIDIANPISNPNGVQVGIICVRIDLKKLNDILIRTPMPNDMECFIVDKDGYFITESKFLADAVGKQKIDLEVLKQKIGNYVNYRNVNVYGNYFPVDIDSWIMVVEKETKSIETTESLMRIVGEIGGALEIIVVLIIQKFLKVKFNTDIDGKDILEFLSKKRSENKEEQGKEKKKLIFFRGKGAKENESQDKEKGD